MLKTQIVNLIIVLAMKINFLKLVQLHLIVLHYGESVEELIFLKVVALLVYVNFKVYGTVNVFPLLQQLRQINHLQQLVQVSDMIQNSN